MKEILREHPHPLLVKQDKYNFMRDYVIGRCNGNMGGLDGVSVVGEAEKAWKELVNRVLS